MGAHALTVSSVWRGRRDRRAVALTFDDGPDPEHTPRVLDLLAAHGVRASFFLIGERAARCADVARRVVAEGHDLGNHSWSHRCLWRCGPRATAAEVERGHEALADTCGAAPRYFRAPWGLTNLALFPVLRRLGTPLVFWSAQPEGRRATAPALQAARVRRAGRPGAIVDLHDADGVPGAGRRLVEALPSMIDGLRGAGFALVPLRELL
jgi:peptidoglycan/xylan/chitin deacetylase (PgdA/CDA1 family)